MDGLLHITRDALALSWQLYSDEWVIEGPGSSVEQGSSSAVHGAGSHAMARRLLQEGLQGVLATNLPPPNTGAYDTTSLAAQQAAAQEQLQQPSAFQQRGLRLPPHVYLISFILLTVIMSTLLMCHCYRIVRIAQRMRRGELQLGVQGAAGATEKRGTPRSVIDALPILKVSSAVAARPMLRALMAPAPPQSGQPSGSGEQGDALPATAAHEGTEAAAAAAADSSSHPLQPVPPAQQQPAAAAAGASGSDAAEDAVDELGAVPAAAAATDSADEPCAICLSPFERGEDVKQLPCAHFYHPECIDAWLERDVTCPLCKQPVADEEALAHMDGEQQGAGLAADDSGAAAQQPFSLLRIMMQNALAPLNQPRSRDQQERRMQRLIEAQIQRDIAMQRGHQEAEAAAQGEGSGSGRRARGGGGGDVALTVVEAGAAPAPAPGGDAGASQQPRSPAVHWPWRRTAQAS